MNKKRNGNIVVLGIFERRQNLENCVEQLKEQDFRSGDVSAHFSTGQSSNEFGLLSVHCDDVDWADIATEIMEECWAESIACTREASSDTDYSGSVYEGVGNI